MYRVELQEFEGPMDLLLFFIKRDEIDIYDIPIARIADEYLAYVRVMEEIDLDGVGDFVYMAALLISIKAEMLLPSSGEDENGEEVDPRRELVERLLEYVRFKEAATLLEQKREQRQHHFTRGDTSTVRDRIEDEHEARIGESVYDLIEALGRVLETRTEEDSESVHEVDRIEHSVEEQQRYVLDRIQKEGDVPFETLVEGTSKGFIIATFLAILELTRQRYLRLELSQSRSGFSVVEREEKPLQPNDPALHLSSGNGSVGDGAVSS